MRVLLLQMDGKIPNIALMRIAQHHRERRDVVTYQFCGNKALIRKFEGYEKIYASLIFQRTRPLAEMLLKLNPALVGGTGWDIKTNLEDQGISTIRQDYSIYPRFRQSIGFTQRGCRLKCKFCVVPEKEGPMRMEQSPIEIWRGDPWPKELILLDNDFFGQANWYAHIDAIRRYGFKVSFNQGINARFLTDDAAAAIASIDYRDDSMKAKRIYTAWDNLPDEKRLFAGLELLTKHGVKPDHIMVYMLVGYWPGETAESREYRRAKLREFGARPYPMPFVRNTELIGFQRWVIGAYDKRISWKDWSDAGYRPERLGEKPIVIDNSVSDLEF